MRYEATVIVIVAQVKMELEAKSRPKARKAALALFDEKYGDVIVGGKPVVAIKELDQ